MAEFKRKETNQQEVVEAITAGKLTKVPGQAGRWSHEHRRRAAAVRAVGPRQADPQRLRARAGGSASSRATSGRCRSSSACIIIAIVFQTQNDRFLTAGNFVNLIVQTAPYAVIAMGVTFVLLLGEIDLSIGFVSGVGGVLTALLLTPDGNELPTFVAIAIALGAGLAIGTMHGLIITKIGVPSFVVTLAGLLAWNGVVLLLIGSRGTVILQNDFVIGLANDFLAPGAAWMLAIVCVVLYAARPARARAIAQQGPGCETDPPLIVGAADRRPGAWRWRSSSPSPTRTAACRTRRSWSAPCSCSGRSS